MLFMKPLLSDGEDITIGVSWGIKHRDGCGVNYDNGLIDNSIEIPIKYFC